MPNKSTSIPAYFPLARHNRQGLLGVVLKALSIYEERQTLRTLDDHLLRDIGVSHTDAVRETKRAVWDAPNRWVR